MLSLSFSQSFEEANFSVSLAEREITILDYLQNVSGLRKQLTAIDKLMITKRKMLLDLEKENIMTIASALRAIPKKPPKNEKKDSGDAFDELFG